MSRALITGASSGIGRDLAIVFAQNGWDLVLVARRAQKLDELAQELKRVHGISAESIPIDLFDPISPEKLFREVSARGLQIDALVNNAGIGSFGLFAEVGMDTHTRLIELNITCLTKLTKLFLPPMLERKKGYVLNVASTAAFQPGPLMAVYYASKAYVLSFSEAISNELEGSGVSVTTLCPGAVRTGFQEAANMTQSKLFRHVTLDGARVAREGYRAMTIGKRVIVPGLRHQFLAFSAKFVPRALILRTVRQLQEIDKAPLKP